jgi:MFS superfamily sulfate permease-like transporter
MSTGSSPEVRTVVASREMKWRIIGTAFAAALVTPLAVAQAAMNDWGQNCTGALQLNFCGSTEVSASVGPSGQTYLVLTTVSAAVVAVIWAEHGDGSRTISAVVPATSAGDPITTPEPTTLALIGTGLIALAGGVSRRRTPTSQR